MRNARLLIAVSFLAMIAPPGNAAASEPLRPERTIALLEVGGEPVRIVAFGDSITGVYYHTGGRRAWCDMLGEALRKLYPRADVQMINAGISGHTSERGLGRMDTDVCARKPHLVVVMFGMNDCTGNNLDRFRANMAAIVTRCREAGAEVVLCTPNNVYPNEPRPEERLARFAQVVRDVAAETEAPLADCFQAYEDARKSNQTDWRLLMSEFIHPNMNGHRLFAEEMAKTITGKAVSLDAVPPPDDALAFTVKRLRGGQPVKIVAMQPYDEIVPAILRERFPQAEMETVTWPVKGKSLDEIEAWAKNVRNLNPNLVVFAIPGDIAAVNDQQYVRQYCWSLAQSFSFGRATFDTVPVLPSVAGQLDDSAKVREELAKGVIRGYDVECIERLAGCTKTARQIVSEWIEHRTLAFFNPRKNAK